jgi:hypothetical protein
MLTFPASEAASPDAERFGSPLPLLHHFFAERFGSQPPLIHQLLSAWVSELGCHALLYQLMCDLVCNS